MSHQRANMKGLVFFIQKNWRLFTLAIVIILIGMFIYRQFFTLFISSTNPNLSTVSYLTPFIELNFNKPIQQKSFKIKDPADVIDEEMTRFGSIKIRLYTNTEKFDVDDIESFFVSATSTDGHTLTMSRVSFTVKNISFDNLPSDQQKVIKRLEDKKPTYYTDPIFKYVPHSTLDYNIQPNFIETADSEQGEQNALSLDITVYIPEAEKLNEAKKIKQYLDEAKDYIRSNGLDPDNYLVNLIISNP